jgi:succinyl-CoA synthetase alpha subunit
MSILIDEHTNVLVQGITGRIGRVQTGHMKKAGTRIVAGVTPGKGGMVVEEVPVYGSVQEARSKHPIDASVLFVPAAVALASCLEAIDAGVKLILLITEHVPVHDTMRIRAYGKKKGARIIGPTTPGVIVPGKCKIGIMPVNLFCSGPVGIISRSGTLAYEIGGELTAAGIGQSTVVGMGADPVVGTDLPELLDLFECDEQTEIVVVVGEVGGTQEERAAEFVREKMKKPVIAFIAGRTAPQGVRMGHAGAIASRGMGSAESKVRTLLEAGVQVAEHPGGVPGLVKNKLKIG